MSQTILRLPEGMPAMELGEFLEEGVGQVIATEPELPFAVEIGRAHV